MKVDLIRKYKWYLFGAIAVVLIMSIGLSFCAWDDHSIKSMAINIGSADYDNRADEEYLLVVDNNNNSVADLGDIVTYGKYYQTADATSKDPIRWIVVHKENNELTLLAESVMAFGNFWNRYYVNTSGAGMWENSSFTQFYQNYMVSTLSMWLNSDYGARHDKGTAFTANASKLGMRGFMNEAFTSDEISHINSRTISGIQGYAQNNSSSIESYTSKSYKVWVPSWSEIYGTTAAQGGATIDGSPNTQFQYFKNQGVASSKANPSLVGKTTAFASTPGESNYTTVADTSNIANAQSQGAGGAVWWWLRSPHPSYYHGALVVYSGGSGSYAHTDRSHGGVRPAICINA